MVLDSIFNDYAPSPGDIIAEEEEERRRQEEIARQEWAAQTFAPPAYEFPALPAGPEGYIDPIRLQTMAQNYDAMATMPVDPLYQGQPGLVDYSTAPFGTPLERLQQERQGQSAYPFERELEAAGQLFGDIGMALPRAALDTYNTDIPVVSDFMRETGQPFLGDVGAFVADTAPNMFMADPLLDAVGIDDRAQRGIGRFVGEMSAPVTLGDFALEATPLGLAGDLGAFGRGAVRGLGGEALEQGVENIPRLGNMVPVEPERVTLFRGEGASPHFGGVVDQWGRPATFYTPDESIARAYAGPEGTVSRIEIPRDSAEIYGTRISAGQPTGVHEPTGLPNEVLLPNEVISDLVTRSRTEFRGGSAAEAAQMRRQAVAQNFSGDPRMSSLQLQGAAPDAIPPGPREPNNLFDAAAAERRAAAEAAGSPQVDEAANALRRAVEDIEATAGQGGQYDVAPALSGERATITKSDDGYRVVTTDGQSFSGSADEVAAWTRQWENVQEAKVNRWAEEARGPDLSKIEIRPMRPQAAADRMAPNRYNVPVGGESQPSSRYSIPSTAPGQSMQPEGLRGTPRPGSQPFEEPIGPRPAGAPESGIWWERIAEESPATNARNTGTPLPDLPPSTVPPIKGSALEAVVTRPSAYDRSVDIGRAHLDNPDILQDTANHLKDVPVVSAALRVGNPMAVAQNEPALRVFVENKNLEDVLTAERQAIVNRIPQAPEGLRAQDDGMITVQQRSDVAVQSRTPGPQESMPGMGNPHVRVAPGDVFQNPEKYFLYPEEQKWIADAHQLIDAKFARLEKAIADAHAAGVPVRDLEPLAIKPEEHYWPRFTIDDNKRLQVGGRIGAVQGVEKARLFDDMTIGVQRGVDYVKDPKAQLELYLHSLDKREADIAFARRMHDLGVGKVPAGGLKPNEPYLGRFFDKKEQQIITAQTGLAPRILSAANIPGLISRLLVTGTMDIGTATIQLASMVSRPAIWGESFARGLVNLGKPSVLDNLVASPKGLDAAAHGVDLGKSEYYDITGGRSLPGKVLTAVGTPAQRVFDGSLKSGRILIYDSLADIARKQFKGPELEDRLYQIGRFVNTLTGATGTTSLGIGKTQQAIESLAISFAPRYSRSGVALIGHALSGHNITANEARRALLAFAVGGSAVMGAIGYAQGGEERMKEVVTPGSGKWLNARLGDNEIGLGGVMRRMIDTSAKIVRDPSSAVELSEDNAFLRFFRSQTAPTTGILWDLISGKDFLGQPVPGMKDFVDNPTAILDYAREKFAPFTINAYYEAKGDLLERLGVAGASAGGLRNYPVKDYVLLNENWSDTLASGDILANTVLPPDIQSLVRGREKNEVGSRVRAEVERQLDPERVAAEKESARKEGNPYQAYEDKRESIKNAYGQAMVEVGKQLQTTNDAFALRKQLETIEKKMYEALEKVEWPGKEGDPAKKTEMQRLEDGYRALYHLVPKGENGQPDYQKLAQAQKAYVESVRDPNTRRLLEYNVEPHVKVGDNPIQQLYDSVRTDRNAYYAIPKDDHEAKRLHLEANPQANATLVYLGYLPELRSPQALEAFQKMAPNRQPVIDWQLRTYEEALAIRQPGRSSVAAQRYFDLPNAQTGQPSPKEAYRRENPAVDAELFNRGWVTNLVSLDAYNIVFGRGR